MTTSTRPFPPALPHGSLKEVLPGIYFVTGTVKMPGPLPVRFSRNMTVVREGEGLVLINSVRLDDAGLAALDALGRVTDVIRLAGFHGLDDRFYKDRYGAKVWAVKGQRYTAGFDANVTTTYFDADVAMDASTPLPISDAKLYVIASTPPEALLLLERSDGTLVAGDCLQNWAEPDAYFSFLGSVMMRLMGFIRAHNVGPGWLKQARPPADALRGILGLRFANVLPSHGTPVLGDALERFRPSIERATKRG
jgi:hypothetical protein